MSRESRWNRAQNLREQVHELRLQSYQDDDHELYGVLKRVEREFDHTSFTDHVVQSPIIPLTRSERNG